AGLWRMGMANTGENNFDFNALDDLMLLKPDEVCRAMEARGAFRAGWIGPIVEYALHRHHAASAFVPVQMLVKSAVAADLNHQIQKNGRFDLTQTSLDAKAH